MLPLGHHDSQTVSTRAQGGIRCFSVKRKNRGEILLQRLWGPGAGDGEAGRFSCQSHTSHPTAPPPQRPEKVQAPSPGPPTGHPCPPAPAGYSPSSTWTAQSTGGEKQPSLMVTVKVSAASHPNFQHEASQIRKEEASPTVLSPPTLIGFHPSGSRSPAWRAVGEMTALHCRHPVELPGHVLHGMSLDLLFLLGRVTTPCSCGGGWRAAGQRRKLLKATEPSGPLRAQGPALSLPPSTPPHAFLPSPPPTPCF